MSPVQASNFILNATREKRDQLDALIKNSVSLQNYSDLRLNQILLLLDELAKTQSDILNVLVMQAYREGWNETYKDVTKTLGPAFDFGVVNVLVKDTLNDYRLAIDQSKTFLKSVFKLAKQDILSEVRISEITLEQIMAQGTFKDITKQTVSEIMKAGSTSNTVLKSLNDREIQERFNRAKRALIKERKIPAYLKTKVLDKVEAKLHEGKFITILSNRLDKFGKRIPMTFSLDYYSSLVARTRFADSQVQGTLDAGERLNVQLYLVTEHGTTTKTCKIYEGNYLTRDPKLVGKTFEGRKIFLLTEESKPVYHPNCKHRLIPVPITDEEYASIVRLKNAA
ncbi:hypothetical protein CH368_14300 [Leptospira levettii]|nr:hypothetical protein CH368_14300 [Leptospira levettii]